jgi:hypothetical protein
MTPGRPCRDGLSLSGPAAQRAGRLPLRCFSSRQGLSLIFGVTRIVNFAHGSFYMLGLYTAWS